VARVKNVELKSGSEVAVRSLPLRDQGLLIKIVADIMVLLDRMSTSDGKGVAMGDAAEFIANRYDAIVELIEHSLVDPKDAEKIAGIDDTLDVLMAIYEVNGGANLMASLGSQVGNLANGLQGMASQISPESGPKPVEESQDNQ